MPRTETRHRGNATLPAKGSKMRKALALMLRPSGVTMHEIREAGLYASSGALGPAIDNLRDYKGWDIRAFKAEPERTGGTGPQVAWRVVGCTRPKGRYRSFIHRKDET